MTPLSLVVNPGSWFLVPGSWFLVVLVVNPWFLVPGILRVLVFTSGLSVFTRVHPWLIPDSGFFVSLVSLVVDLGSRTADCGMEILRFVCLRHRQGEQNDKGGRVCG